MNFDSFVAYAKCGKAEDDENEIEEIAEKHVSIDVCLFLALGAKNVGEERLCRLQILHGTENQKL